MKKLILAASAVFILATFTACSTAESAVGYIGAQAARTAALADAGLADKAATFNTTDLEERDGVAYYRVSFTVDGVEHTAEVDALTGVVLSLDGGTNDPASTPAAATPAPASAPASAASTASQSQGGTAAGGTITEEQAKNAALTHAGLAASDVTFLTVHQDRDNGRLVWDVEFYTADYKEYDYEIDASTAEVVSFDYDVEHYARPAAGQNAPTSGEMISAEQAKNAALTHAGLAAGDVTFIRAELDRDNGRTIYDVEFYTADYKEYDYEIDAVTAEVVSYDFDAEYYTAPASGSSLTAEQAKALALAQVPGAAETDIWEFEIDRDNGRIEYEGKIVYGGVEYEFEIDGYSGAIRSWEAEPFGW